MWQVSPFPKGRKLPSFQRRGWGWLVGITKNPIISRKVKQQAYYVTQNPHHQPDCFFKRDYWLGFSINIRTKASTGGRIFRSPRRGPPPSGNLPDLFRSGGN